MDLPKKMILFVLSWISMIEKSYANYCDQGFCSPSEYCCRDKECCSNKTTSIIIFCLLTALVIASVCCACCYRHIEYYRLRMQWPFGPSELLIPQTKA